MTQTDSDIIFNDNRDIIWAYDDPALSNVLHVFDRHWHGIRSATSCLPGGKLGISHRRALTGEEIRHIEGLIIKYGFKALVFQGYSETADRLIDILYGDFGKDLPIYVVTHVTTTQFEHAFEMQMLNRIYQKVAKGILAGAGSVKPNFHQFLDTAWHGTVINLPPNISKQGIVPPTRERGTVFIPVENTWRKNLYTQVIAAHGSELVERMLMVNWPSHLDQLVPLDKIKIIGFQPLTELLSLMGMADIVMNVTLAECQPMTQLEALAMGTPTITGPLRLPGFSDHPLGQLCEVTELDDPGLLRGRLDLILSEWRTDPKGMSALIADFLALRIKAGLQSYREFLGI